MNLGDGLLFELENGKPKIILLNHGEKISKNPVKPRPRLPSVLSCRQTSRVDTPRVEEQPIRKQVALNGKSLQNKPGRGGVTVKGRGQAVTSKTQENHVTVKEMKTNAKVKPAKPQNVKPNKKPEGLNKKAEHVVNSPNQSAALSDNVSCLTNVQLQQILDSFRTNNEPPEVSETQETESETKTKEDERKDTETKITTEIEKQAGGLLRWVEQRPSEDRAALEAKKAQWKKELDEQMVLKMKHCSTPARIQDEEDTENSVPVQSSVSYKDLPAAIRSSLRVGESAPVDESELTQEEKLQQRRLWLQELDKQREETSERKRLEKIQQRQTEDLQLWASHFDSLHRPPVPPPALPRAERAEEGGASRLSQWEDFSVRASVDTNSSGTGGQTSRASHLRTMTSLLDPAELEERERRRLKQLEQQRAIELQVEERRRRREEEEARMKREEEEEERRVQEERERLQRQYERETLRERPKEPSNPEAQPAVRDKTEPQPSTETTEEESPAQEAEPLSVNHQRDTAVQTEAVQISESSNPESLTEASPAVVDRAQVLQMLQLLQKSCGTDVYEPFSKTEQNKRETKRPEWNTQRPSRRFVPASKRYPEELQRQRQENRLRRQAQLLSLQKNPANNQNNQQTVTPATNPTTTPSVTSSISTGTLHYSGADTPRGATQAVSVAPPTESQTPPISESPTPDFLPYVRTDEVFHLNQHETQTAPSLLQKTQRQQEIIRGLAQLREGLLLKQRELESELSRGHHGNDLLGGSATLTSRREL